MPEACADGLVTSGDGGMRMAETVMMGGGEDNMIRGDAMNKRKRGTGITAVMGSEEDIGCQRGGVWHTGEAIEGAASQVAWEQDGGGWGGDFNETAVIVG